MQNPVNEIGVVENSNLENQDATRSQSEVENFRNNLSIQVENGEFNRFFELIEQHSQARDNRPEENLRAREFLIQASEVLHPRDRFLRNYIESPSILLMNNLSKTALCYLALTAEVIGGIAGYCYTEYPENAMNGTNILEANITGTNITGTNILRSGMNSRSNCMEEKITIAMIAIPSALLLSQLITKISDSFRSRRSLDESQGVAPQNDITINRENQQATNVRLVADIAMARANQV